EISSASQPKLGWQRGRTDIQGQNLLLSHLREAGIHYWSVRYSHRAFGCVGQQGSGYTQQPRGQIWRLCSSCAQHPLAKADRDERLLATQLDWWAAGDAQQFL